MDDKSYIRLDVTDELWEVLKDRCEHCEMWQRDRLQQMFKLDVTGEGKPYYGNPPLHYCASCGKEL